MLRLALLGGMSWESSALYYRLTSWDQARCWPGEATPVS